MDYSRLDVPNIRAQLKELERRRYADPDLPVALIGDMRYYVAYRWEEPTKKRAGRWTLLGFVRVRRLQFPRIRQIRARFKLDEGRIMKLTDLFLASKVGAGGPPWRKT